MNKYRIDRADSQVTPCGMNSIIYIGDKASRARDCFYREHGGLDPWGKSNPQYGLLFSKWNGTDYVCIGFKDSLQSSFLKG
jgi:hypothetical protein